MCGSERTASAMMNASRASGLRAARVEAGDAAHRQAGKIDDLVTGCASDRDRQRPDRRRLVHHDQQRSVPGELVEQAPQLRFAAGQRSVGPSTHQTR
jgi:hypothetical protein